MSSDTTLRQFMNLYWLRPETAVYLTIRSEVLKAFPLEAPAVDLSCGDGIFPFVHLGGRLDPVFDTFESVGKLDAVREGADIYDAYSDLYQPPILEKPAFTYTAGADLKETSLQRARALGLYEQLVQFDATQPVNLESGAFQTVTNFASINHYPQIDVFLAECRRLLKPGGTFIIDILGPNLIEFYAELEAQYPAEWVDIIERKMRAVWPTMHDWRVWQRIFEAAGFEVTAKKGVGTSLFGKMWNVGFRPLSPGLIGLRNIAKEHAPDELWALKHDWVDLLCDLAKPFMVNSDDLDDAAGYVFVLRRT